MKRRLIAMAAVLGLFAVLTTTANAALLGGTGWTCKNGYVSLSFDDGPTSGTSGTKSLLSALNKENMRATFFVVGTHIMDDPTLITNIVTGGHSAQNHSWEHQDFTPLAKEAALIDLAQTQGLVTGLTRNKPTFYRPPYGNTSTGMVEAETTLGLTEVLWTVDTLDWDGRSAKLISDAALTVKPGGFVLMHDGYKNTVAAIPAIAAGLKDKGLCAGKIVKSDVPTNAWWGRDIYAKPVAW